MLPTYDVLRKLLQNIIIDKEKQGHETNGLYDELKCIPESYDALNEFATKLSRLPYRNDWKYYEPSSFDEIMKECDSSRPHGLIGSIDVEESSLKAETGFYSSVCGCILGKPLEEFPCPTLYEIKEALEKTGAWPLEDYVTEEMLVYFGRRHRSWPETIRENIRYAAPDDDITYKIIGMLLIEKYGINFSKNDIKKLWIDNLPIYTTWGPERNILIKTGLASLAPDCSYCNDDWGDIWNPGEEQCGALIRVDTYGFACPGRPDLAAELAFRDASLTHRKTGIYGAMFVAAAIAAAYVMDDRMEIIETALKFVPQRSRFYEIAVDSLLEVKKASNWEEAYGRIHGKYSEYEACRVYQEIGTLFNTIRFAENISDGFCKQVSQGNDTDSFGATAGSLLGVYFGPDYLDRRWIEVFNDDIYTTMGDFRERRLSNIARRMTALPGIVDRQFKEALKGEKNG